MISGSTASPIAGVDVSSGGWLATVRRPGGAVETIFAESFDDMEERVGHADPILVDVPIVLPTDERRTCDIEVRRLLGCRASSVFFPPCQAVIEEDDYGTANGDHESEMGKGLSQQAFYLRDSIRKVNDAVAGPDDGHILESHPEVCFYALNGQPVGWSKTSEVGRELRLDLLDRVYDDARSIYERAKADHLRKEASRDDILDAMVLAAAADETLRSLPGDPREDQPRIYYQEPIDPVMAPEEVV